MTRGQLGVHVCHVKALNPTSRRSRVLLLEIRSHGVLLCSLFFTFWWVCSLLANFGSRSRFLLSKHFSYLNTEELLAYFCSVQATTGNLEWRPRLGGHGTAKPNSSRLCSNGSNFSCISYISLLCVCQTTLPHVLDQDLKQMLQEFVLAVLMFDFPFLFFSSFFCLQISWDFWNLCNFTDLQFWVKLLVWRSSQHSWRYLLFWFADW